MTMMTRDVQTKRSPRPLITDNDTWEGEIACRNVLFGLWAGRRLGLSGDRLEAYAWSVHVADGNEPGHDDMIAKVARDLAIHGAPVRERMLRDQLREMWLRAGLELDSRPPGAAPRTRYTRLS